MSIPEPHAQRFISKIVKRDSGCWAWTAGRDSNGYGVFWYLNKSAKANRVAWLHFKGSDPNGMVLHTCDNKGCVNPDHLYIGDHEQNMRDAHERRRFYYGSEVKKFVMFDGMIDRIKDLRRQGMTIAATCLYLNIDRSTFFDWKKRGAFS